MSNLIPCRSKLPVVLKPVLFLSLLALSCQSCKKITNWISGLFHNTHIAPADTTHWLNWNFYFGPSVSDSGKAFILDRYRDTLLNFARSQDPTIANVAITLHYCPCDSSLTNLDATIVGGSGKSISAPPTVPKPGPSGDYMLSNNILEFQVADTASALSYDKANKISIPVVNDAIARHAIDDRVLAIIDTGLDTAAFSSDIRRLMWRDRLHPTLYDVMPGDDAFSSKSVYDGNPIKHGTAAAALAISQITNNTIPRIMAIKAFDVNEKGSIYTVSCALSYAIQKHVNFINASWGYFGDMDSVLFHYVKSASDSGIAVIAAAGNTAGNHPVPICNPALNSANLLQDFGNATPSHLFYPACFSTQLENVISVHQLQSTGTPDNLLPCFYQNYSGQYVNLGILTDDQSCCKFRILSSSLEGSSFATPVATGMLMSLRKDGIRSSLRDFVDANSKHYRPPLYTRGGNYLGYVPHLTIR